jgi:hypothetical protein
MSTIQAILEHYQDTLISLSIPYEKQASKLQAKMDELAEQSWPIDPVKEILNGVDPLIAADWAYEEVKVAEAMQLVEQALERLGTQAERARSPLESRTSHIVSAYQATLKIKENVIKMHPAPKMFIDNFNAQYDALLALLHDCPQPLVDNLNSEINSMALPQSFNQLVA